MVTKEIPLSNYWRLYIHPSCSTFVDMENPNRYTVLDWDKDDIATILVDEHCCTFENVSYGIKHEVNLLKQIITIFHEPNED